MHGEDLLVNDGSDRQAVEAIRKCLPKLDVVSALAFVVKAVDAVDGRAFVVPAEDEKVLGVLDLVGKKQADGLERLLATVDVVTEEKVVRLRREATVFEEAQKIVVLAVDISADLGGKGLGLARATSSAGGRSRGDGVRSYLDRSLELEQDGLRDEDLASLSAEIANLCLQKLDLLARAAAPHLEETIDYRVEIDFMLVRHCKLLSGRVMARRLNRYSQ